MTTTLRAIAAACALLSAAAFSQTVSTSGQGTATASPTGNGVVTINQAAVPASTTAAVRYSGQPASSLGTVIASPPVQNTCDSGGFGIGGNNVSGGALLSLPGRTEEGCDAVRDVNVTVYVEEKLVKDSVAQRVARQRICRKATIRSAYEDAGSGDLCKSEAQKSAEAAAALGGMASQYSADPLIAARQRESLMRGPGQAFEVHTNGGYASK